MVAALRAHYLYYTGLGSRIRKLLGNEQYVFADRSTIWLIFINCFHCDSDAEEIKVLFDVAQLNELSSVRKIEYVSCYLSAEPSRFAADEGCIMYCLFSILKTKAKILKKKLFYIEVIFSNFYPCIALPHPHIQFIFCLLFKCQNDCMF